MKSIILPLTRENDVAFLSNAAAGLATKLSADVTGLFVRRDPKHAIPLLGEGLTADMIQQMCDATEREGLRYAAEAEQMFSDAMTREGVSIDCEPGENATACWRTVVGDVSDHVGRCARTTDFAICERPDDKTSAQAEIFNDLIFRSGRSVLMVPKAYPAPQLDTMIVAWNGRAECARAVGAALPLLQKAKKVTVLQIGDIGEDRPTLADIDRYLSLHGIACEQLHVHDGSGTVGEQVYAKAQETSADSIVIGAFSTARWRELILGGVTRHLIETSDIPIYMSH